MARLFGVLDLCVGERGGAFRTPVDDTIALIDQAFFIEVDKHLAYGAGKALIHCETLAAPVAGGAQRFQLFNNTVAVEFFPLPYFFEKLLAAEVIARQTFFTQLGLHLDLRGDTGMVGTGHPESRITLHPFCTDQDIL